MAKYSYITDKTHNNRKIQVESAKRDGSGKNIENNYAKQNGNYQSFTAGLSNNFDTKKVMVDESAYNFRPTATMGSVELEVGSPCKVKKIIGGSVAFNQLGYPRENTEHGATVTFDSASGKFRVVCESGNNNGPYIFRKQGQVVSSIGFIGYPNHKYIVTTNGQISSASNTHGLKCQVYDDITHAYSTETLNRVFNVTGNEKWINVWYYISNGVAVDTTFSCNVHDLTQMFGSTIADYIYSLEQANAGSGVAWFKRYFPKEYYAYNSGELVSVKTQGKKITHFNQWDEEVKTGYYLDGTTGQEVASQNAMCSKNFCECMPNTSYYFRTSFVADATPVYFYDKDKNYISRVYVRNNVFTTPINAWYMRISFALAYGTTYNHDICINFHYDGERDGEYEPYNSETYPCDDIELRGIPQLDENNNLAFDGDEYANDGNVTRKYGIVDLGTLSWGKVEPDYFFARIQDIKKGGYATKLLCQKYPTAYSQQQFVDKTISGVAVAYNNNVIVKDSDYDTYEQIQTAMSGVMLIYELATPTDENSIPFTEVQECDNWGTEEWLAPTTDTRPCEVPVGHETDYLPDLKAKVEVAPNTPNENGVYVMEHNASGNSYTPIATWLSENGYTKDISRQTILDNIGGTLRHQLSNTNSVAYRNTNYVDLGTLTWSYSSGNQFFYATLTSAKGSSADNVTANIMCSICEVTTAYAMTHNASPNMSVALLDSNKLLYVKNSSYADATTFKNAMKGVLLAYEKAS